MADLTTAASVAHDLGVAANFGGNLFGKLALSPAVGVLQDERERMRIVTAARTRYKYVNSIALAIAAGSWFVERAFLSRRVVGRRARRLTLAKDITIAGAAVAGLASLIVDGVAGKQVRSYVALQAAGEKPAVQVGARLHRMQRLQSGFGYADLALAAGLTGVSAALAIASGRSIKKGAWSRLLH
jgi:hypothetical protein